jgi:hypothetical protein
VPKLLMKVLLKEASNPIRSQQDGLIKPYSTTTLGDV